MRTLAQILADRYAELGVKEDSGKGTTAGTEGGREREREGDFIRKQRP